MAYLEQVVLPILLTGLNGPDEDLSWQSAYSISQLRAVRERSIPLLLEKINDPTLLTRIHAAQALHDMEVADVRLVPVYAEMLALNKNQHGTRSLTGANGLAKIGKPAAAAIPQLVKALTDQNVDYNTRARAALALPAIDSGSDIAFEGLMAAYRNKEENVFVRCMIVDSLSKMKEKKNQIKQLFVREHSTAEPCAKRHMMDYLNRF